MKPARYFDRIGDCIRDCVSEDLSDEDRIHFRRGDHTFDGWVVSVTRGLGPTMQHAAIRLDAAELQSSEPGPLVERVVYWIRQTLWLWSRPGGMVVGVAGKWRKWGRAA